MRRIIAKAHNPNQSIPLNQHQTRDLLNHNSANPELLKKLHAISITKAASEPSLWSDLIKGYLSQGFPKEALIVYIQNRSKILHLAVLPVVLKACASPSLLLHGKAIHSESIKVGVIANVLIGTSLLSMYAKCGCLVDARQMFNEMPVRNVITRNAMIGGYSRNGDMGSATSLFECMSERTSVTWAEMIGGFAQRGDTAAARSLFDRAPPAMKNLVTWTVMVDGYASNGEMDVARQLFDEMPERNFFVWSSMIAGYCKKGDVEEARKMFDQIPVRNLVNWNALIAGYAQNGYCEEAMKAFRKMLTEGFNPDEVTVASMLSACAQLGSLDSGKEIHEIIIHNRIKLNQFVLNSLIDMYAKCGDVRKARQIFEAMSERNEVCWNVMISALGIHGQSEAALELFSRMEASRHKPNDSTFLAALSACAHGGFVKAGLELFAKMKEKYGLVAGNEHYGCLVDLLGRAGKLNEAYNLIRTMPMKPNSAVWGALLGACRIHMDMEMVEKVVEEVGVQDLNADCGDDARYMLLSNIYAAAEQWQQAEKMRMSMVMNGVRKTPGCSSIMVGSTEH